MANVRVTMIRPDLANWPQYPLPAGFAIRWYQPGDEAVWLRLHVAAERFIPVSRELYDRQFGGNEAELARRQAFLVGPSGQEIGTATGWFNDAYHGQRFGRVHWVAILPEYQGRSLSKPLLTVIGNRLIELGHDRVYLSTSTVRRAAIKLYLDFGFQPEINTDDDRRAWAATLAALRAK